MKQFQKISLSGAMISALVLGLSTGAANAGGSDTNAPEDGSYYYYEVKLIKYIAFFYQPFL